MGKTSRHIAIAIGLVSATAAMAQDQERLLAATRGARDDKNFVAAEQSARDGLAAFPSDPVWPLTLALVLADSNRPVAAIELLNTPTAQRARPRDRQLALAYAQDRAGEPWAALASYGEVLHLVPDNQEALAGTARLLAQLGGPFGATALGDISPATAAARAGVMTRWGGEIEADDPRHRYDITDAAIAELDAQIAANLTRDEAGAALVRRLRLDLMVALRDRRRMSDTIAQGRAQGLSDTPLPSYARLALADALLAERKPRAALAVYNQVLATEPRDLGARYGRVFALVESEDLAGAATATEAIVKSEAAFFTDPKTGGRRANPEFAYALLLHAQVMLWGNRTAAGTAQIDALVMAAPANSGLRRARASAWSARGWTRAADEEARIAASLAPGDQESEILLARGDLARHRFEHVAIRVAALSEDFADQLPVQQLTRDYRAEVGWLYEAEARPVWNNGGGTNALGHELQTTTRLTSPVLASNWRLFADSGYAYANLPEGYVDRGQLDIGVIYQGLNFMMSAWGGGTHGTTDRGQGGARARFEVDDHLAVDLTAELFSPQTPLRALRFDIRANRISFGLGWRQNETRSVGATVAWLPFSDGNNRFTGGITGTQRLVSQSHFDLTGRVDIYWSTNSRAGGPYFNPRSDVSASLGLEAQHVVWRSYERSLMQVVSLEGGWYHQSGFGDDCIGVARYEHRWRFDPWREFRYGVSVDRRVYDGKAERGIALTAGLRQRF